LSSSPEKPQILFVGQTSGARPIAFRRRAPAPGASPGLVWLGGFKSDMESTKAGAIDEFARERGRAFLRFDYSGHGASGGRFEDGAISRWLEESLAVFRALTEGPQILVGSSMGGYLALLLARELERAGELARLSGMVLIAPAVDFTQALIWERAPEAARRAIMEEGGWTRPSAYSAEPYLYTRALIEDGRKHLLLGGIVRCHCPARILQGMRDEDVPFRHALTLIEHMADESVTLTLVRDGDHRLSRPQDLALLLQAIETLA
jgi:pimeloyl-ACP methyl ester carboxylesterase